MKKMYFSERGFPLLYYGYSSSKILTVENYIKWYNIYVVWPCGRLKKLQSTWNRKYEKENQGSSAWCDHIPTPWFCKWLEKANPEFEWDWLSLEAICGRWIVENHPGDLRELFRYS